MTVRINADGNDSITAGSIRARNWGPSRVSRSNEICGRAACAGLIDTAQERRAPPSLSSNRSAGESGAAVRRAALAEDSLWQAQPQWHPSLRPRRQAGFHKYLL